MKYRFLERQNPQDRQSPAKVYVTPVNDGRVTQQEIAEDIVNLSSLARGDVGNVINSVIDTVPKYLLMGKSVNLGELGTFRISFSSKGVDDPKDFTVDKISGIRVVFTPSVELKRKLATIRFERSE
ncbi:MAG: HU family DNA-binding protein [Dysgonamonadaceae bacterium]|jgi:predicted histone-like DNA-binding protein|nr:HU family DNA-binding protein [Dysgonamonadaceae bacterium]